MLTVNKTVENFLEVFIPMFLIYRNEPKKLFQSSNKSTTTSWQQQIFDEKNLYIYEVYQLNQICWYHYNFHHFCFDLAHLL